MQQQLTSPSNLYDGSHVLRLNSFNGSSMSCSQSNICWENKIVQFCEYNDDGRQQEKNEKISKGYKKLRIEIDDSYVVGCQRIKKDTPSSIGLQISNNTIDYLQVVSPIENRIVGNYIRLQNQFNELMKQYENKLELVQYLEISNQQLRHNLNGMQVRIKDLQKTIFQQNMHIQEWKGNYDGLQIRINELVKIKEQKQNVIEQYEKTLKKMKNSNERLANMNIGLINEGKLNDIKLRDLEKQLHQNSFITITDTIHRIRQSGSKFKENQDLNQVRYYHGYDNSHNRGGHENRKEKEVHFGTISRLRKSQRRSLERRKNMEQNSNHQIFVPISKKTSNHVKSSNIVFDRKLI